MSCVDFPLACFFPQCNVSERKRSAGWRRNDAGGSRCWRTSGRSSSSGTRRLRRRCGSERSRRNKTCFVQPTSSLTVTVREWEGRHPPRNPKTGAVEDLSKRPSTLQHRDEQGEGPTNPP